MARAKHPQDATSQGDRAQKRRPTPVSEDYFLSLAGLDPEADRDRRLYLLMKTEALYAVQDLTARPVEETRFREAMSSLYQSASPDTKRVYDIFGDVALSSSGDNWIIRWLMWQALAHT